MQTNKSEQEFKFDLPHYAIAITGASGAIYGLRILEQLAPQNVYTHSVISPAGLITIKHELNMSHTDIKNISDYHHNYNNVGACLASGSFPLAGMVIAPCSMKTLAEIASGVTSSLISRSADVCLKEDIPLVIIPREAPLNEVHLENMLKLKRMGSTIIPPMPAFYHHPKSIDDLVNYTTHKAIKHLSRTTMTTRNHHDIWFGLDKS